MALCIPDDLRSGKLFFDIGRQTWVPENMVGKSDDYVPPEPDYDYVTHDVWVEQFGSTHPVISRYPKFLETLRAVKSGEVKLAVALGILAAEEVIY